MSSSSRNGIAERRRTEREANSPLNQRGREKMFISRWSPSIRDAFSKLWYGKSANTEPEKVQDDIKDQEMHEASEDESQNDNDSAMNSSTMSEDQVWTQLTMPSPRHVRFELPQRESMERASPSTPYRPPPIPYKAPTPPSTVRMRQPEGSDPIAKVTNYLETVVRPRGGECTEVEALGLSLLLQSAVNGNDSPSAVSSPSSLSHIRDFASLSTSPALKPTFTSPNTDIGSILAASPRPRHASPQRASPSRTLKQNPNGPISFDGGRSSRPYYRSPSFGSPSSGRNRGNFHREFKVKQSFSDNAEEQDAGPTTSKRRRVGEDKETSVAESAGAAHKDNDSGSVNGPQIPRQAVLPPSGIRPGMSRFAAATPARPSPLRQSIRADSSSPGSSNGSPNTSIGSTIPPTSNAFIADALRKVSPRNNVASTATEKSLSSPGEAFLNPYQQSVRHARKPTTKPLRPPPKPTRHSTQHQQPPAPPKKPTALEYIQMTAPTTGPKRVHNEVKTNGTVPSKVKSTKAAVIEVPDEDSDHNPPKKQKRESIFDRSQERKEIITIDEAEDVGMQSEEQPVHPSEVVEPDLEVALPNAKDSVKEKLSGYPFGRSFPSAPKEPSPLRQSFRADLPENQSCKESQPLFESPPPTVGSAFKNVPIASTACISSPAIPATFSSGQPIRNSLDMSNDVNTLRMPTQSTILPFDGAPLANSFNSSKPSKPSSAIGMSHSQPESAQGPSVEGTVPFPSLTTVSPGVVEQITPNAECPSHAFSRVIQEATTLPALELPRFQFEVPSSSISPEVSTICRKAVAVPVNELPQFQFGTLNTLQTTDSVACSKIQGWRCADCSLENKNEVKACVACNKLNATSIPTGPIPVPSTHSNQQGKAGFDWAAAGMTKSDTSGWTCDACFIVNKANVSKCAACEAMKPNSNVVPEKRGFDWAAAGITQSDTSGWRCSVCLIKNDANAPKCVACDAVKPHSNATPISTAAFSAPNPSSSGFSSPVPSVEGWKCSDCSIINSHMLERCAACSKAKPDTSKTRFSSFGNFLSTNTSSANIMQSKVQNQSEGLAQPTGSSIFSSFSAFPQNPHPFSSTLSAPSGPAGFNFMFNVQGLKDEAEAEAVSDPIERKEETADES